MTHNVRELAIAIDASDAILRGEDVVLAGHAAWRQRVWRLTLARRMAFRFPVHDPAKRAE